MSNIFNALALTRNDYDSVPPDSPESDARQIDGRHLHIGNITLVNSGGQYSHRKSFSSDDFGQDGEMKRQTQRHNSTSAAIGQWTASAAAALADTIASSTQYVQTLASGAGPIRLPTSNDGHHRASAPPGWMSDVTAYKKKQELYDPATIDAGDYDTDAGHRSRSHINEDAARRRMTAPASRTQTSYGREFGGIALPIAGDQSVTMTAYVNGLIERFTAPKYSPTKLD